MRHIVGLPRQRDFGIGGEFDLPRAGSVIGDRNAANLGVVLGRDHDFERRRDGRVVARTISARSSENVTS